jgi:hypothetical protein
MARLAVHAVASLGVTKVIHDIIRVNTVVTSTFDAVRVATGTLVIGSLISEVASKHVNDRINDVVAWNNQRKADNN